MTRSKWKGLFIDYKLYESKKNKTKIMNRSNTVLPIHIGSTFNIYTGKDFLPVKFIKDEMIGYKFGEFAFTKKKCVKLKKEKKNFKIKGKK